MTTMLPLSARALGRLSAVLAVALLGACSTLPVYQPAGEATAILKTSGAQSYTFQYCGVPDGQRYRLEGGTRENPVVRIPAGRRILVNGYTSSDGYNVIHYCNAMISFEPSKGTTYAVNSGMVGPSRCFIELVKEDLKLETGVDLERSVRPGRC